MDSGSFFFGSLRGSSEDARSVKRKVLLKHAGSIFRDLKSFRSNYQSVLPPEAYQCINDFLSSQDVKDIDFNPGGRGQSRGNVQFALTSLAAFRSEFSFLIADTQAIARRITERAFVHLQRSIMVHSTLRRNWIDAFDERPTTEILCEQLGAVHLLSFGIWAFKVSAPGGRTDLVLNEPLETSFSIDSVADALVLTEWKIVRNIASLHEKIREARRQAELYSQGVLGGIELLNYRYLVMVSRENIDMPHDVLLNTITYKAINIAVDPRTPGITARRGT